MLILLFKALFSEFFSSETFWLTVAASFEELMKVKMFE
jgi:hypothetical protein